MSSRQLKELNCQDSLLVISGGKNGDAQQLVIATRTSLNLSIKFKVILSRQATETPVSHREKRLD
jgi:hypothetical protein